MIHKILIVELFSFLPAMAKETSLQQLIGNLGLVNMKSSLFNSIILRNLKNLNV